MVVEGRDEVWDSIKGSGNLGIQGGCAGWLSMRVIRTERKGWQRRLRGMKGS